MKTFRKSSLISSVALLLVAIVALSGATFAWFSTSSQATATNLQASTTSASNLVVSDTGESDDWGANVDYEMGETKLEPASTVDFKKWWTNTADVYDGGTSTKTPTDVSDETGYYVVKDLYIKNDGSAAIDVNWTLTLTETATGDADAFRVAFQKVTDTAPGSFVYANANDDAPLGATGTATTTIVTTNEKTGSLGNLAAGVAYQYRIYLYYEGTDAQCIDSLAKNTCAVGLTFDKATPVAG